MHEAPNSKDALHKKAWLLTLSEIEVNLAKDTMCGAHVRNTRTRMRTHVWR